MNYYKDCFEKFNKLPDDIKKALNSHDIFNNIINIEKLYDISIKMIIILVLIGDLNIDDIPEYLEKIHNLESEDALDVRDEIAEKIINPIIKIDLDNVIGIKERTELIFNEGINNILQENNNYLKLLNQDIIASMSTGDGINPDKLEKILYKNEEKLTYKKFVIDKTAMKPTVGNWIRAFVKQHGSSMFSNILLSRYMVNSLNVKRLDHNERELVQRLLKLYKNVKFFPDSLANIPPEAWEIIPFKKEGEDANDINDFKTNKSQNVIEFEDKKEVIDLVDYQEDAISANSIHKVLDLRVDKPLNNQKVNQAKNTKSQIDTNDSREDVLVEDNDMQQNKNQDTLQDLQKLASHYPEGSLERMMVEEEIKKIN